MYLCPESDRFIIEKDKECSAVENAGWETWPLVNLSIMSIESGVRVFYEG